MLKLYRIRQYILDQNFYNTETDDEHIKRKELISSRFYLILLMIILYAYAFYITSTTQITPIIVFKPTIKEYKELIEQHPNTLSCPCERIAISYGEFINILPVYHQICSSDFVSQQWIDYLFYENSSYYFQLDFRHSASAQFQILRALCEQAEQTVDYSLTQFYSSQFITNQLISMDTFDIQTNSFIELFKRTTSPLFLDIFSLIRQVLLEQLFVSGMGTQYTVECCDNDDLDYVYVNAIYYYETQDKYFHCMCLDSFVCKLPGGIYTNIIRYDHAGSTGWDNEASNYSNTLNTNATFLLPGIFVGCVPIESLFYSTIECLFEDACFNQIGTNINYTSISIHSFSKLNQSLSTSQTTYETLINNLFIQQWNTNISFNNYFDQCQPLQCQYTNEIGQSWTSILALVISLYGGLGHFLPFIILVIVNFLFKIHQNQQAQANVILPEIPMKTRWKQLTEKIVNFIRKLNIFQSGSNDEHIKQNEILSTRFYFIALPILLTIFGVYLSLDKQIKIITIDNPTQNQYEQLKNNLFDNLQCPCSHISIKYNTFIIFQPRYHQICSSIFVSELWLDNTYWQDVGQYFEDGFHQLSPSFFHFLLILCQAADETVINNLVLFNENEYLTSEVVSSDIFTSEVTSFIELFKTTTQLLFQLRMNLIRQILSGSQLVNLRDTNSVFTSFYGDYGLEYHSVMRTYNNCSCAINRLCKQPMILYSAATPDIYNILGIVQACFAIETLLLSTTECFFSKDCISTLRSYMLTTEIIYKRLIPLNTSISSQYQPNTTIETIVNNLFVEDWNEIYSYSQYYDQCQPSYCSYTMEEKPSSIYIFTKLIAIYGGIPFSHRIRQLFPLVKTKLINLNLFQTHSTNPHTIRKQLFTTRFYIIILIIIFPIILSYILLNQKSISVTVKLQSLDQYNNLRTKYPTTITCPCTDISIRYDRFIELNPSYHQICSSDFVSQQWFEYLFNENKTYEKSYYATASAQFQILSSLCKQAQEAVNSSLIQFYSTKLTSSESISSDLLQIQIDTTVNSFKTSMPQTFKQALNMLSNLIHGNTFITAYETNWKLTVLVTYSEAPIYTNPQSYGNSCSCATSLKCSQQAVLNDTLNVTLPGLLIGCYPLESLLQSSLECLYNQQCLNLIINSFGDQISNESSFEILNSSLLSESSFEMNETVQNMVDRLFVNEWNISHSYQNYYEQCHPSQCTYSYIQNSDIPYVVTTIVGLYGGITIVLKVLSKFMIQIFFWIKNRKHTTVAPFPPSTN
ncbi:unnamed protein product [Adineta steineri]|uniref:Uncharacterized protein n=1 Tax=Adineta steineri TaxID=433720 RepID=A0A814KP67_9BILA|nr:unnamed protein product [Adineta steineri]CAF1165758.1 unnamed protein product [Adineta steineri]CAF1351361.1 unnamed protein product [Adineta steineri]